MGAAPEKLPREMRVLLTQARAAGRRAYAPYSKFHVGAALVTARGGLFTGCNVENASYGLTICAERAAIFAAAAAEGPKMRLARLAIAVDVAQAFAPCGACRQVLAEFGGPETEIVYAGRGGAPVRTTLGALLPQAFAL